MASSHPDGLLGAGNLPLQFETHLPVACQWILWDLQTAPQHSEQTVDPSIIQTIDLADPEAPGYTIVFMESWRLLVAIGAWEICQMTINFAYSNE